MAYVIAEPCIDVKDGACARVCPVDCIYEGGRMFYIQPHECIDCGVCLSVCPVEAIFPDDAVPEPWRPYTEANAAFFSDEVTGWGSPGGLSDTFRSGLDHPLVARHPRPA
jgi:NAD-dependent dihydropyrimidine dehydrogenase PreA subunit